MTTQVSLENGIVLNFDARTLPSGAKSPSPSRFTLHAHDGAASSIDVNPHIRGCIATGGTDKLVKVWNVTEGNGGATSRNVSLAISRDLGVVRLQLDIPVPRAEVTLLLIQGKVFSAVFSPDDPLTLAVAGSKAKLQIWDVGANFGARKVFTPRLVEAGKALREKERAGGDVVAVASDDEDGDDD